MIDDLPFQHLFEIPVYRVSKERFYDEKEKRMAQSSTTEKTEEEYKDYRDWLLRYHSWFKWNWRYNQIVGYILICLDRKGVRYYLATPMQKRISYLSQPRLMLSPSTVGSRYITKNISSQDVYVKILEDLKLLQKTDSFLKRRFLDLEAFTNVGQYVDWIGLINDDKLVAT